MRYRSSLSLLLSACLISSFSLAAQRNDTQPIVKPEKTPVMDVVEDVSVYQSMTPEEALRHFMKVHKPDEPLPTGEDFTYRAQTLKNNIDFIAKENQANQSYGDSLRLGVTSRADLTQKEYQDMLQVKVPAMAIHPPLPPAEHTEFLDLTSLPPSLDWRKKGVVGPVKNQWFCGSCYIFSAVGVIETGWAILKNNGHNISLSEQQALDCNGKTACKGGWPVDIFKYAKSNGLCQHGDYNHYWSHKRTCNQDDVKNCKDKVYVDGYYQLPKGDDDALLKALQGRSVSIAMDASSLHFQFYLRGIFRSKHCPDKPELNHALEVVGYGEDGNDKYWIVKNSWGKLWGDWGYIKVDRNTVNTCGISEAATYPTIKAE